MKVCITRNAEARTNAGISRIVSALECNVDNIILLTRNRFAEGNGKVEVLRYNTTNTEIVNYEINLKSNPGRGIVNIVQLVIFQFILFKWLLKNRNKYDIIHAFDLDSGLPTLLISVLLGKKYVYHIADFYIDSRGGVPKFLKNVIRRIEYSVINGAETTIICTEDRARQIEGSKPKELVVVHNTPIVPESLLKSIQQNNEIRNPNNRKIKLTYVGALAEKRFIRYLIDVIKRYPNVTLNIAGMGKLEQYVKEASIEYENINYFGMIDYTDALKLYSDTDYMFAIYDPRVPNHRYSAPNKVYEAMILGKPIIVAKGTGIDQIVSTNKIGITIDYSIEAFEKVLTDIISNPDLMVSMANNSKKVYVKYSWIEMKNKIINIYQNIR
ncbi:glycosyltransferase [Ammoniphilus sp. CFH 90114]|uniref:glycosyltransferase n=1 Tax=Ammoniphilus sp. CFH 90114 TaxID=2493665 RepID=UPI0013E974F9|nr:glycosyltransferase [Ammoniphilus sp. CFH 90114]